METEKKHTGGGGHIPDGFEPARKAVLAASLELAPFEGWTRSMMERAAGKAEIDCATLAVAFPKGVADLLTYWSEGADAAMTAALAEPEAQALRIREKVALAITKRLDFLRPHKEAARRAAATLALPVYAPLAARLAWRTADAVWRALADASTDFNFYTKRATLTGVWTSTLARWLADDDPEEKATKAFLDARIENVMQFEKVKKRVREAGFDPAAVVRWLAKLRYADEAKARSHQEEMVDEALEESFPASDPPYWTGGER